jgi:carbon monoxide dehydrogenase subunit G
LNVRFLPSIVEASEEILVNSAIGRCFSFFTDLVNIGSCIPGSEKVELIDSTSANLKVKLKVGYISRTFELKAKIKDVKINKELSFVAEGPDAEVTGYLNFSEKETGITKVTYRVEIKPISVMGKTAISMMGKDLVRKQASEFASCVKQKLESC